VAYLMKQYAFSYPSSPLGSAESRCLHMFRLCPRPRRIQLISLETPTQSWGNALLAGIIISNLAKKVWFSPRGHA
jgi:hypothetical protein